MRVSPKQDSPELAWLSGGGEMGARVRGFDWDKTPLGPPRNWPQSLQTAVSTCLNCSFPILIWWGRDLIKIYNDAYAPILGNKHPFALGQPGVLVWREIWGVIGPMLFRVLDEAVASPANDLLLMLERSGYAEECYFSFSYSPIYREAGRVGGVFCPVIETTEKIISARRLATLRELAALRRSDSLYECCRSLAAVLQRNDQDLPFAYLYLINNDGCTARLCSSVSDVTETSRVARVDNDSVWPFSKAQQKPHVFFLSADRMLPKGAWAEHPRQGLIAPVFVPSNANAKAFLVLGLNPHKALDQSHRSFLDLVVAQVGALMSDTSAYESERKRSEALAELDKLKTAFFANVSHEFRTPLTLMLSPLEDAINKSSSSLDEVQRERLDIAHRNALRLLRLVNSLLDFSRIEAGRVEASYRPTDLAALTGELASSFRAATEKAGLRLVVDASPLSQPVYVDRDMWEKIVLNLLSNAFKFTFEGEIAVELKENDGRAVLTVRDTGTGIPIAELPKLFDRFHRVEGAQGRSFEGSGIGLALVQELVKLHCGDISVDSEVGRGTAFTVAVPFGAAQLPPERVKDAPDGASPAVRPQSFVEEALRWLPGDHSGDVLLDPGAAADVPLVGVADDTSSERPFVLVADDNTDLRGYISRLLAEQGYVAETVADGKAALAAARARRPDLLVTDVMMPRLDGFGLLRAIREDDSLRDLPVVMLSARAGEEAKVEGLDAGADDYLTKPFSARELLARVAANIAMARIRREAADSVAATKARAARVLDGMSECFGLLDRDFRIIHLNAEAMRLENRPREAIIGQTHWEAYPGSEDSELGRLYKRAMAECEPVSLDHRYVWEDGRVTWLNMRAYPVDDGLAVFYRDVTEQKEAEETLRATEARAREDAERVRLALDAGAIIGTWDWHLPSDRFTADERFACSFGLDPELCRTGLGIEQVVATVHPDDKPGLMTAVGEALARGGAYAHQYRVMRADGNYYWVEANGRVYYDAGGAPLRFPGVLIDLQHRRAIEAERDRATTLLRTFIDAVPGVVYAKDREGRMLVANRGTAELIGKPPELFLGKTDIELLEDRDQAEVVMANDRRIMDSGISEVIEEDVRLADGTPTVWLSTKAPLRDETGAVIGLIGASIDITARKEAEGALREAEERLRLATEAAEVGFWDVDVVNDVLIWPPRVKAMFGISADVPVSMADFYAGLHPEDRAATTEAYAAACDPDRRVVYNVEYRTVGKEDGAIRWVAAKGRGVFNERACCVRVIGTAIDVTERKRVEAELRELNENLERRVTEEVAKRSDMEAALRQAQKMEAVGQLTGGIAHDFNNLLTIITGGVDMARRALGAGDTSRATRAMTNAKTGAERAAALTHRLLAFSRRQPLAPKPVNGDKLISGMVDLLHRPLGETVKLEIVSNPGLWRVEVDPNQLESAILNLVVNARDAMPDEGMLTIETANARLDEQYCAAHAEVSPGNYVVVAVTDTGTGMSKETIARVFDPFFTTKEVGKGTGLGLSMVYGFVKQSGGHVAIYSEQGHGTTVKIYLPRLMGEQEADDEKSSEGADPARGGQIILVVEDDDDVRAYTVEILRELGYRVLEAPDGPSGIRLIERRGSQIDLLLTDVVMPGMSGRELADKAREIRVNLKVLYISGYPRNAIVHNGRFDAGVEMISKPFTYEALANKITDLLETG